MMPIWLIYSLVMFVVSLILGIVFKVAKKVIAIVVMIMLMVFAAAEYIKPVQDVKNNIIQTVQKYIPSLGDAKSKLEEGKNQVSDAINKVTQQSPSSTAPIPTPAQVDTTSDWAEYVVQIMDADAVSNTDQGAAKYSAQILLGNLDNQQRPTYAHIRVSDAQEPGTNGEKRADKINVNPEGWKNYQVNGQWVYDRLHMVGYQFSGLMDELRNLFTGTRWLNRGVEGNGTDQKNVDSMLYYEQQLDNWVALHPNYKLDYYVKPIFYGNEKVARAVYMQWVGIDENGNTIEIQIGGRSERVNGDVYGVVLENVSPSFTIDYATGKVTPK